MTETPQQYIVRIQGYDESHTSDSSFGRHLFLVIFEGASQECYTVGHPFAGVTLPPHYFSTSLFFSTVNVRNESW